MVSPPVCGVGHMQLCTAACGAHTCAREPLMHFEPSGAAGAARPLTLNDSHPYCLLYYLAYNDRKVKYNERNGQGEKQGQDSHLQRANWCTIVLCEIPSCQFFFAGCAFHFSGDPPENGFCRLQFKILAFPWTQARPTATMPLHFLPWTPSTCDREFKTI